MGEHRGPRWFVPTQAGPPVIPSTARPPLPMGGIPVQGSPIAAGPDRSVAPEMVPASRPQQPAAPSPDQRPEPDLRFHALFGCASTAVVLSEPDGRITDLNPLARDLLLGLGLDPDHAAVDSLSRHLPVGSDAATAWREGLAAVREGRRPVAEAELAMPGVDPMLQGPRWVRATAALITLGQRRCLIAQVVDVTERRAAEQPLEPLIRHGAPEGLAPQWDDPPPVGHGW